MHERFSVQKIGVFGSYAKEQQTENSDLDILYQMTEGCSLGLKEMFAFEAYLKEILEIEKIDLVNKKFINPIIELDIEESLIYV